MLRHGELSEFVSVKDKNWSLLQQGKKILKNQGNQRHLGSRQQE